jgi:hypothetical protein
MKVSWMLAQYDSRSPGGDLDESEPETKRMLAKIV